MRVNYKFKLGEKVLTALGKEGSVSMLGYYDNGIWYYVEAVEFSDWFLEADLEKAGK